MAADLSNKFNFIIPAAGKGRRLRPFTNNRPKCMVNVGNKSIIEHQLESIPFDRVKSLTVITGYKEEQLRSFFSNLNLPFKVQFYFNELYCETHCAYSLLKAQNEILDGFIYINSDLLFSKESIIDLLDSSHDNAVCIRGVKDYGTDLQQVCINSQLKITEWAIFTKTKNNGELVGPLKISKQAAEIIFKFYNNQTIEMQVKLACYTLFSKLLNKIDYYAINIDNYKWFEIDTVEDLSQASKNWNKSKK